MAHFSCKQFARLFGLLATGNVKKHPKHCPAFDVGIITLAPCGNPAHVISDHDPEIDLVWTNYGPSGSKSSTDSIAICRMNFGRQILENHERSEGDIPEAIAVLVHREMIRVNVPRPQCNASCVDGEPEVTSLPFDGWMCEGRQLLVFSLLRAFVSC